MAIGVICTNLAIVWGPHIVHIFLLILLSLTGSISLGFGDFLHLGGQDRTNIQVLYLVELGFPPK